MQKERSNQQKPHRNRPEMSGRRSAAAILSMCVHLFDRVVHSSHLAPQDERAIIDLPIELDALASRTVDYPLAHLAERDGYYQDSSFSQRA